MNSKVIITSYVFGISIQLVGVFLVVLVASVIIYVSIVKGSYVRLVVSIGNNFFLMFKPLMPLLESAVYRETFCLRLRL